MIIRISGYRLHFGGRVESYPDSKFAGLGLGLDNHNGLPFTTPDMDLDKSTGNCAKSYKAGWWFKNCMNGACCLNCDNLYCEKASERYMAIRKMAEEVSEG